MKGFFFFIIIICIFFQLSSGHDLEVQIPVNVENEILSSSPNQDKRKRGRPAEGEKAKRGRPAEEEKAKRGKPTPVNVKSGRLGFHPAPRTRAKMGNRRAMIEDCEAENSASSDESDKKMLVDLRNGSANNDQMATAENQECEYRIGDAAQRAKATHQQDTQGDNKGKELDNVQDIEQNDAREGTQEIEMARRSDGVIQSEEKKDTTKKLEVMSDPVQAMLLDMIPTLGLKKAESERAIPEDEKPETILEANPAKKKKVSYKDVAGDLLKDW